MEGEGLFISRTTPAVNPKILASFIGVVEAMNEKSAKVLLVNEDTKERLDSGCDPEVLRENGIGPGDQFRCEIVRVRGTTTTSLTKLPAIRLSTNRIEEIRASHKDRWTF